MTVLTFALFLFSLQQPTHSSTSLTTDIFHSFTYSTSTLPEPNRDMIGGYDPVTDLIWILGGDKCKSCVYTYNLTDDSILTTYTSLDTNIENRAPDNSVVINGTIYYIIETGEIGKYDTVTQTQTHPWFEDPESLTFSCLTSDINQQFLFMVDSYDEFWIIDIAKEIIYEGPNLNYDRNAASCIVSEDNYLYVLFGNEAKIERINVNYLYDESSEVASWEVLSFNLDLDSFLSDIGIDCSSFDEVKSAKSLLIDGVIYLLGLMCSDDNSYDGVILKFDTDEMVIEYIGELIEDNARGLVSYVYYDSSSDDMYGNDDDIINRVYFMGGYLADSDTGSVSETDAIYYSNDFDIDDQEESGIVSGVPSNVPSTEPSTMSTTSMKPSEQPTVNPTLLPSNIPSAVPTSMPTAIPTDIPSNEPSSEPSGQPTVTPTDSPTELIVTTTTESTSTPTEVLATTVVTVGHDVDDISVSDGDSDDGADEVSVGDNDGGGSGSSGLSSEGIIALVIGLIIILLIGVLIILFCCGYKNLSTKVNYLSISMTSNNINGINNNYDNNYNYNHDNVISNLNNNNNNNNNVGANAASNMALEMAKMNSTSMDGTGTQNVTGFGTVHATAVVVASGASGPGVVGGGDMMSVSGGGDVAVVADAASVENEMNENDMDVDVEVLYEMTKENEGDTVTGQGNE